MMRQRPLLSPSAGRAYAVAAGTGLARMTSFDAGYPVKNRAARSVCTTILAALG